MSEFLRGDLCIQQTITSKNRRLWGNRGTNTRSPKRPGRPPDRRGRVDEISLLCNENRVPWWVFVFLERGPVGSLTVPELSNFRGVGLLQTVSNLPEQPFMNPRSLTDSPDPGVVVPDRPDRIHNSY